MRKNRNDAFRLRRLAIAEAEEFNELLAYSFDRAMRRYDEKIRYHLERLEATNGKLAAEELGQLLSLSEKSAYEMDLKEYIELGAGEYAQDLERELQNASGSWHISHYKAMQGEVQGIAGSLWKDVGDKSKDFFINNYTDLYYRSVKLIQDTNGKYKSIAGINRPLLEAFLNEPWAPDKRKFTDRLLNHSSRLTSQIYAELAQIAMGTQGIGKTGENVAEILDISYGYATRLVYNETMYHLNDAKRQSYETEEVEMYEYVATLDMKTTPFCRKLDGKRFKVKDYQSGFNAPPHPGGNCRSVTVPVTKYSDMVPSTRSARGKDGRTGQVKGTLSYKEWRDNYVED